MKNVFDYLPRAYEYGATDPEAREKMANASCMAGMAFANAFLGVCHSMAHKLGAYPPPAARRGQRADDLPTCCATTRRRCRRRWAPSRSMTTRTRSPAMPNARASAAFAARTTRKRSTLFIDKIEELKAKVGIKKIHRRIRHQRGDLHEHAGSDGGGCV